MKNLFENLSSRTIRVLYSIAALIVLGLGVYNFLFVMVWRVHGNDQCQWVQKWGDSARVHITGVKPGSSADYAGLREGDLLLGINGKLYNNPCIAEKALHEIAKGDTIFLQLDRDRKPLNLAYFRWEEEEHYPFKLHSRRPETLIIRNIVPGGSTDRAGIEDGDILLRIDNISIRHSYGAQYLIDIHSAGSIATFLVDRDGELLEYRVEILKTFNFNYLAQFLLGLGFLLVGYFVVMAKPEGTIQRKFARFSILAMFFFSYSTASAGPQYDPLWTVYFFLILLFLARLIVPPVFITFFLHFPKKSKLLERRWFVPSLWLINAVLTYPFIDYMFGHISGYRMLDLSRGWILFFENTPFLFFLIGLGIFTCSYFKSPDREQRKRLRPIMQSAIVGILAFIYTAILTATYPLVLFLEPVLLLPILLVIGIPPAFGYSIVKYKLMDVTLLVKRSIIYAVVTAMIAMIYVLLVFGLGHLLGLFFGQTDNKALVIFAFVIVALIFEPVKRRVQKGVDKLFYQERYNYIRALTEFSRELPRQINLEQILVSMVNRISTTMHVDKVSVALCDEIHGCTVESLDIPRHLCEFHDDEGGVLALLKDRKGPVSFAVADEELNGLINEQDLAQIREAGSMLFVPMFLQDRLIGAIIVGPKLSGKLYSQEDIDLLSTVGSQAAIAIENARLHISEIEKQKMKEQLSIARRIQVGLLPKKNPPIPDLDISGISIPAMTVGGDYFDYIQLPDDRLLVVVGDVSGKGMSAALYMSNVQGMIRFAAHQYDTPKQILTNVNQHIYDGIERNSFITMILVMFDMHRREVTVCRAGHTQPLLALNGELHFIGSEGMGLGLERGELFDDSLEEIVIPLKSESLFLLYSDGLTEAMDMGYNEFGEERLLRRIEQTCQESSRGIQDALLEAVETYRGSAEQHDDITLVVIKVK